MLCASSAHLFGTNLSSYSFCTAKLRDQICCTTAIAIIRIIIHTKNDDDDCCFIIIYIDKTHTHKLSDKIPLVGSKGNTHTDWTVRRLTASFEGSLGACLSLSLSFLSGGGSPPLLLPPPPPGQVEAQRSVRARRGALSEKAQTSLVVGQAAAHHTIAASLTRGCYTAGMRRGFGSSTEHIHRQLVERLPLSRVGRLHH